MKALVLAASGLLAGATPALAKSSNDLIQRASDLEAQGRFAPAIEALAAAAALRPDYWTYMKLAQDELALGRLDLAKKWFAKAKRLDPKQASAYIAEGYAAHDAGDETGAERTFRDLVAADTASFAGYHHLGAYLAMRGRDSEAERCLKRAIALEEAASPAPTDDLLHSFVWLGAILNKQGRRREAAGVYERGLKASAAFPDERVGFLRNLGDIALADGRPIEAESYYQRSLDAPCPAMPACELARADTRIAFFGYLSRGGADERARRMAESLLAIPSGLFEEALLPGGGDFAGKFLRLGMDCRKLGFTAQAEGAFRRVLSFKRLPPSSEPAVGARRMLELGNSKTLP